MDLPETEQHPHVVRVGWSVAETDMTVGESKYSIGYGATGKKVNEGRYDNYGETFGIGDVIGCFIVSMFASLVDNHLCLHGFVNALCYIVFLCFSLLVCSQLSHIYWEP